MDKNELLKYLICEIDLVMHDKDYRFENEDGTWYSRESCKNLTNEEVFEELKSELRQLAKIEDDFADLESKLAEKEKENSVLKAVIDKNKLGHFGAVHICNAISEFYEPLVKDMIIAELEKVEKVIGKYVNNIDDMNDCLSAIDQQIKSLKGEK